MATAEGTTDRGLGYLGLFLIGAISWAADHLGPAHRSAPAVRTRTVPRPRATPGRAARRVTSAPITQHTSG